VSAAVPPTDQVAAAVTRAFRDERAIVLATLIRQAGDFQLAEDAVQDAFEAAITAWRRNGVPTSPGAWITTAARRRAIDRLRRNRSVIGRAERLAELIRLDAQDEEISMDDESTIVDDRLRLIFTCCHPALEMSARVALTLRALGGLTTGEIARAFLVAEPTMGKRIVRAKRKIAEARIPYRVPTDEELPDRLRGVLRVVYLIFNEGYAASEGDRLVRGELCDEAIRLGEVLVGLMPDEAEVWGLSALMLLHHERSVARVDPGGRVIAMGRALLVCRLVRGDVRRRWVQSLLLIVMVLTTTTTLALALHHSNESPFARTKAATKGPDFVAENGPAPGSGRPSASQFAPLLQVHGVAATAGPFPVAFTRLTAPGINVPIDAEGRNPGPSAIDRPLLTAGHWVSSGGAVIEQGLATSLGLHVGDTISLGGHKFRVVGIALSTAQPFYPASSPGLVWLTRSDAVALATSREPLGYVLDIKMAPHAPLHALDAASKAFATAGNVPANVEPASAIRAADYRVIAIEQKVLLVGTWLIALLSIASIAVVVGGRMAEQNRRVGLLKAVGDTPAFVAIVLLAENVLLALAAAIGGLILGTLIVPALASPGDGLLGTTATPQLTIGSGVLVIGVALLVAMGSTLAPTIRGARTSTLRALNDPAHTPRRRPRLMAPSAALPVPMLLALRLVARRPRRTVLTAASLLLAVTMVVTALTVERQLQIHQDHTAAGFLSSSAIYQSANHVLLVLSLALVCLAAVSATFTAWATIIDTQVATALARALGATPRQINGALTTAQLLPGLAAACLGIPTGLLLYQIAGGDLSTAIPPLLWLLGMIPGTLIAIALVTAVPAGLGARRPVAEMLRAD
jgi:RNA polymerase sigma factor (sigma-70 family)